MGTTNDDEEIRVRENDENCVVNIVQSQKCGEGEKGKMIGSRRNGCTRVHLANCCAVSCEVVVCGGESDLWHRAKCVSLTSSVVAVIPNT